jgi:hypothetical protein
VKSAGSMMQVVKHLLSKLKTLTSNPSTTKKKKINQQINKNKNK